MKVSKLILLLLQVILVTTTILTLIFLTIGSSLLGRIDQHLLLTPCDSTQNDVKSSSTGIGIGSLDMMGINGSYNGLHSRVLDGIVGIAVKMGIAYMTRSETESSTTIEERDTKDQYYQFCMAYRKYRCHFRMDEFYLSHDWKRIHLKNVSFHSNHQCNFSPISNPDATIRNTAAYLPDKGKEVNILRTVVVDQHLNETYPDFHHLPVLQIKDLGISIQEFFKPVISTNISGSILNVVFGPNTLQMKNGRGGIGNLEVPIPVPMFFWVGNLTLNELFDLIPPPPEEEGLYPRLGVTNVMNATIRIHDKGDYGSVTNIRVPDEYFMPLLQVTIDAGYDGIDQVRIDAMVKEWIIMVIRKELLGEDKIRVSFDKYNDMMKVFTKFMLDKLKGGGIIFDEKVNEILTKTRKVLDDWDEEWKELLANFDQELSKLVKDIAEGFDEMKENADKIHESIDDMLRDVRREATQGWEDMIKNFDDDLASFFDEWETIQNWAQEQFSPVTSPIIDFVGETTKGWEEMRKNFDEGIASFVDETKQNVQNWAHEQVNPIASSIVDFFGVKQQQESNQDL